MEGDWLPEKFSSPSWKFVAVFRSPSDHPFIVVVNHQIVLQGNICGIQDRGCKYAVWLSFYQYLFICVSRSSYLQLCSSFLDLHELHSRSPDKHCPDAAKTRSSRLFSIIHSIWLLSLILVSNQLASKASLKRCSQWQGDKLPVAIQKQHSSPSGSLVPGGWSCSWLHQCASLALHLSNREGDCHHWLQSMAFPLMLSRSKNASCGLVNFSQRQDGNLTNLPGKLWHYKLGNWGKYRYSHCQKLH